MRGTGLALFAVPASGERSRGMGLALFAFSALLLFMLSGCVNVVSSNPISTAFELYGGGGAIWWATIAAAGAMGTLFVALGYMFGSLTGDDKLKAWVKREIGQLIYSMILAVIVVALSTGSFLPQLLYYISTASSNEDWKWYVGARCTMLPGSSADKLPCHIAIAEDYLDILFRGAKNEAQSALSAYTFLSVVHSIGLEVKGIPDPAGIVHFSPFAGLSVPVDTLANVIDLSVKNMMAIRFQQFLLYYMHVAFFPLFLALGIILRTLFFTRKIGALFIALAISFYIIFPMVYVYFHSVLFSVAGPFVIKPGGGSTAIDLDELYKYQINWQRGDGSYVTPLLFASNMMLSQFLNNGVVEDSGGNVRLTDVQLRVLNNKPDPNSGEVVFSANDSDGVRKTFYARAAGGDASVYGEPYPQGMMSVPANPMMTPPPGTLTPPTFLNSEFREKYGDPGDPNWNTDKKKVKELLQTTTIDICIAEGKIPPDSEKGKRYNVSMRIANEFWEERLHEGYVTGIYYMLDPVTGGILGKNGPVDNLAKLLVFSLLAPFFAIMISLSSVKVMAPLLGGDAEIAGLTRLI